MLVVAAKPLPACKWSMLVCNASIASLQLAAYSWFFLTVQFLAKVKVGLYDALNYSV